jgi:hypothetical protein
MNRARYIVSFIIIMLSIGINVGQHLLEQLNIDRNYLVITLVAITIAGLLAHRHLFFIVLVSGLTVAVNLPADMLQHNHINPEILFATLLAVIIAPTGMRLFGWKSSS